MEPTQSSETLAYKIQTPGKFSEDNILHICSWLAKEHFDLKKNSECIILKQLEKQL
jgi:hypothetical protein